MKPKFSEILIPASRLHSSPSTDSSIRYIEKSGLTMNKCLISAAFVFAIVVAVVTTIFIVRYEDRLSHYEHRILRLEKELSIIHEKWEDEYGSLHTLEKDFEYDLLKGVHENIDDEYNSLEDEQDSPAALFDHDEDPIMDVKIEEIRSRKKRQIPFPTVPTYGPEVERTADGVPVLEKSYLDRTDKTRPNPVTFARFEQVPTTTDSEGLRLYEGLWATGGRNEPKSLNPAGSGLSPILPHHRTSAAWSEKSEVRSSGLQLKSGDSYSNSGFGEPTGPQFSEDSHYRRTSSGRRSSNNNKSSTGAGSSATYSSSSSTRTTIAAGGPGTYHRSSRVPATTDFIYPSTSSQTNTRSAQYPPLKRLGQGDGEVIARVLQTDGDSDGVVPVPNSASASANYGETATAHADSRRRQGARRVTPKRQAAFKHARKISDSASGEISFVKAEAWVEGPKSVAAHYVADVSNYTTAHRHYEGNGRLRNADGIFEAWKPSDWMETTSADENKNFVLNKNGVLTVKKTGLYYIYAQIHYLDEHDINGYVIQVNTTPFLQCTTMTETRTAGSKSNSCFTAGITHLKENDRILIKDIETNRYSIFKPEKSFFGLMKIGETGH